MLLIVIFCLHSFLNIATGKDRASYKELVEEFSERFTDLEAFDDYKWYFTVRDKALLL